MSNIFTKIGHGIEVAGKDVVHVVEDVVTVGGKVIKVIEDAEALTPQFKTELALLINDAKPIATALAPVIATAGKNPVADIAAVEPVVEAVIKLAKDFISFIPTIEAALTKLDGDATAPAATTSNA